MTRASMSIGYTKILGVKPHLDCHFHSKSYRIILNNHETSSEMFRVVSNVRDNLHETFSIFTKNSTHDVMTTRQISWFSDFVWF